MFVHIDIVRGLVMLSLFSHFLLVAAVLSPLTMPFKALVIYNSWCNDPTHL